ncbi:MAG: hypothetical protein ACLGHL_03200, partial [Actinomycetota bacterium]
MRIRWVFAILAAVVLLAACGGGDGSMDMSGDGATGSEMDHGSMDNGEMMEFGRPGDPADATRKVEVEALDSLAFQPEAIEVEQGETVTFVVINTGKIRHEFTLGDEDFQNDHAEEMQMNGMGDSPNSVVLEPGETK